MHMYMYTYTYIHIYICIHTHIYIYTYSARTPSSLRRGTVGIATTVAALGYIYLSIHPLNLSIPLPTYLFISIYLSLYLSIAEKLLLLLGAAQPESPRPSWHLCPRARQRYIHLSVTYLSPCPPIYLLIYL